MPKVRATISCSLDGFVAGPNQSVENPLGENGERLHDWMFATRAGRAMLGEEGGGTGIDNDIVATHNEGIGAAIMGRNMFGPVRGAWPDHDWTGWWGENPPFHHDVFVLTHHLRPSVPMTGGTTFHFIAAAPEEALRQAFSAADGQDVRIAGGAATLRQFLRSGLIDELILSVVPILLGSGKRLFDDLGTLPGYRVEALAGSPAVSHMRITRQISDQHRDTAGG
ncbi:dihydrofolate reductase family protein [Nocardia cyriacigeorgica]|uniref:dihydrofolate reductase family protein n=1 Tax=Nocardia cyriacigeorgica TaxID=135487 RepID=UPI001892E5AE|nr:dihydrofolate reductase family protein [Nocardia cyriacigeorgica]MBF6436229.1 dihydrofolate reductase [Nocardia cyriacigeorgica]